MTSQLTLDPYIDALCSACAPDVAVFAAMLRLAWEHRHGAQVRALSGYMPPAQRRAVAHSLYSNGLVKPPRRATAAERAQDNAKRWHGPRPVLACEVQP